MTAEGAVGIHGSREGDLLTLQKVGKFRTIFTSFYKFNTFFVASVIAFLLDVGDLNRDLPTVRVLCIKHSMQFLIITHTHTYTHTHMDNMFTQPGFGCVFQSCTPSQRSLALWGRGNLK